MAGKLLYPGAILSLSRLTALTVCAPRETETPRCSISICLRGGRVSLIPARPPTCSTGPPDRVGGRPLRPW